MKINEIAFVGYPVTDVQRARGFYEGVLGLSTGEYDEEIKGMPGKYWIEYDIGGATLAISNTWEPAGQSQKGPSMALEVEDLDEAIEKMKSSEVDFVSEKIETPVCAFIMVADPDGNPLTIHKRKNS
ncbi:VOC family protein [Haloferula sp.]|uniref:VOC family protein n=1 Tax=Haloferula sp. TaxID=2497595 RepID=UPI00329DC7DA